MLHRAASPSPPPLRHTSKFPASSCTFLQLRWGGKDGFLAMPSPSQTHTRHSRQLHSPLRQGAQGSLSTRGRAQQLQCLPGILPCPLCSLVNGIGCLCVAAEHRGIVKKGSNPGSLHQLPLLLHSLMLDRSHLGNSLSAKGTCILPLPPVSSKDRAPLGRAGALCSSWTSKGKTLIPKMLLNHIKLHPQRQLRSTP